MERNWTTGSVLKNILYFSLPYLLSYFLQTLYGMADLFIIGLAMGSTVMISRQMGENKPESAAKSVGNTVTIFMSLSIVVTVVLLLLTKPIVFVMSTPEPAVDGTVKYLIVCFIGIPFITAYNIISSIFRGLSDTKSPMYFIAVACACNIGLDYLFMGACKLGPLGSALGTTVSQTVSVIVSFIVILKRKTGIKIKKIDFKLEKATVSDILKVGVPVAVQDGFIQIAFIVITVFANLRGLNDSAAVGIVEKFLSIVFLVPSSMLSAVSALSAQNLGAGEEKRATLTLWYSMAIAVVYGCLVAVAVFFAAKPIVTLFNKNENVALLGSQYLRGYIWDCIFAGIHFCFSGYFCACKKSYVSFLHNCLSIVLMRIPCAYFAAKMFPDTLFPMGLAAPLGSVLSVIVCVITFLVLMKKSKNQKQS